LSWLISNDLNDWELAMAKPDDILRINKAVKRLSISWNIRDYAVGVLSEQQKKYNKENILYQERLLARLNTIDKSTPEYATLLTELNMLKTQPEKGFFYTIHLFDQLNINSKIIKKMMGAVLALDTMGRYLFEKRPISFDDAPFVLDEVLQRRNIDTTRLKSVARQNINNSLVIIDALTPIKPLPPDIKRPPTDEQARLSESMREKFEDLSKQKTASRNFALQLSEADKLDLNFDLISKPPTEINIRRFLLVLTELLKHAKLQDSSNQLTLYSASPDENKLKAHSAVAVVSNLLPTWFVLSLIKAPNNDSCNQRLVFIMSTLAAVFRKTPNLPADATADLYIPLFTWLRLVQFSVLKQHPIMEPFLPMINQTITIVSLPAVIGYTRKVKFPVQGKFFMSSLPPMRMAMTISLEIKEEIVGMLRHSSDLRDRTIKFNGSQINAYFNPKHKRCSEALREPMSDDARAIWGKLNQLESYSNYLHGTERRFLDGFFAIHQHKDTMNKQLRILTDSLMPSYTRIFYYDDSRTIHGLEGRQALDYVKTQVDRLVDEIKTKLDDLNMKVNGETVGEEIDYITMVIPWCSSLLVKIDQLKLSTPVEIVSLIDTKGSTHRHQTAHLASIKLSRRGSHHTVGIFTSPAQTDEDDPDRVEQLMPGNQRC